MSVVKLDRTVKLFIIISLSNFKLITNIKLYYFRLRNDTNNTI